MCTILTYYKVSTSYVTPLINWFNENLKREGERRECMCVWSILQLDFSQEGTHSGSIYVSTDLYMLKLRQLFQKSGLAASNVPFNWYLWRWQHHCMNQYNSFTNFQFSFWSLANCSRTFVAWITTNHSLFSFSFASLPPQFETAKFVWPIRLYLL